MCGSAANETLLNRDTRQALEIDMTPIKKFEKLVILFKKQLLTSMNLNMNFIFFWLWASHFASQIHWPGEPFKDLHFNWTLSNNT